MLDYTHCLKTKEIPNQNHSWEWQIKCLMGIFLNGKKYKLWTVSSLLRDQVIPSGLALRFIVKRPTKVQ